MRIMVLLALVGLVAHAQDEIPVRVVLVPSLDPAFRAEVMRLLEVSGAADQIRAGLPKEQDMKQSEARMAELLPTVDPQFIVEWGRRMRKRIEVEYIELAANAYQRHLSREEVSQLTELAVARNAGEVATPSPQLQQRIATVMPDLLKELDREVTELGERMGGEVALEIGHEHPEYADQAARDPRLIEKK